MDKGILDPLYGRIAIPDYAWEYSKAPEVQRLREVRMCNINSLSLTGAGGVHRFEHSIGTAYLAQVNVEAGRSRFEAGDPRRLILAGLLHDVGSAGFGHSVEYVLQPRGFEHDNLLAFESPTITDSGYDYKTTDFESVFFGRAEMLRNLIPPFELTRVSDLISGVGRLGPLISGSVDLDNVDNVYRLAHHMGIWRSSGAPLQLAANLYVDESGLRIDDSAIEALRDWRDVRSDLYKWLLLDEDEFSAKAMLEIALRSASEHSHGSFRWNNVDYSLMEKLLDATPIAAELAARIMTGHLFGCLGVFETVGGAISTPDWTDRDAIEAALQEALTSVGSKRLNKLGRLSIHYIQDVNKTDREVVARSSSGNEVRLGASINRTLIGVFVRRPTAAADSDELHSLRDGGVEDAVSNKLSQLLGIGLRTVHAPDPPYARRLDSLA